MLTAMLLLAALLQAAPAPRVLDSGDQSNMDDARQAVVRTAAELNALWRLHAPERQQPKVNFATEMVVGVFIGSRPSAGFAVEILAVEERAGATVVQLPGERARARCRRGAGHHIRVSAGGRAQASGRGPLREATLR